MQKILFCVGNQINKYGRWKIAVEGKGLTVNFDKTQGMQ